MFDPITVDPATDHAGQEAFQVTIAYDGEEHTVDV